MRAHLQEIEGGGVQKEEGDEIEDPHCLMHKGLAPQVPQRQSIVSVIDEVREGQCG